MKHLVLITVALLAVKFDFAQKLEPKDVPEPVMKKFTTFYSEIKKSKWEKEGTNYEVKFKDISKKKMSVTFTPEGNVAEKEWKIKLAEFPKSVQDSLAKKFPGMKPEDCSKIERNGLYLYVVEYEVEEKGKPEQEVKVEFTPDGKVYRKTTKDEDDDKKKDVKKEEKKDEKKEIKKEEKK